MSITEIHEIELSSRCNLRCPYCPHPKLGRPKEDMTLETYEAAMRHVQHYVEAGTQKELSFTGIGEALLHPQWFEMMHLARVVMGPRPIVMATNGLAVTQAVAEELAALHILVFVSTHRPEKAGLAVHRLEKAGATVGTNTAFVDSAMNWAGQTPNWYVNAKARECAYLKLGWGVVRQDGSVDMCCMDAHDLHPIGHVRDEVGSLRARVIPLCTTCHLKVPEGMS